MSTGAEDQDGPAAVTPPSDAPYLVTTSSGVAALARLGLVRAAELALIALGIGFLVTDEDEGIRMLMWWDLLALVYLVTGVVVLRRSRRGTRLINRHPWTGRLRLNFLFATVASLTGLGAALDVGSSIDEITDPFELGLHVLGGTLAMLLAWVLLHSGYARWYAGHYARIGGGLKFPGTENPSPVDFLYFAITIGTAFSTSDTSVTTTEMRWHVLVHQVIAFFFNAAVLAFALSLLR